MLPDVQRVTYDEAIELLTRIALGSIEAYFELPIKDQRAIDYVWDRIGRRQGVGKIVAERWFRDILHSAIGVHEVCAALLEAHYDGRLDLRKALVNTLDRPKS